jgi:hypothetical protein
MMKLNVSSSKMTFVVQQELTWREMLRLGEALVKLGSKIAVTDSENAKFEGTAYERDVECAWAAYRDDEGVADGVPLRAAHEAFLAGWKAHAMATLELELKF